MDLDPVDGGDVAQEVEEHLSVLRCQKYRPVAGTTIHHRAELMKVQEDLAEIKGVTVLIYDQTCAAEKRRRRKRLSMATSPGMLSSADAGELRKEREEDAPYLGSDALVTDRPPPPGPVRSPGNMSTGCNGRGSRRKRWT